MKANLSFLRKFHLFSTIGILSTLAISCGSYQNSSYYDNDGIYGTNNRYEQEVPNKYSEQNIEQSNKYAQQFKNMQDDYTYFTDVEDYSSETNDTVITVYKNNYNNDRYGSWGSNTSEVTVNYYNNGWNNWYSPYWGSGWYGSNWGWGYPYYGSSWGWNNWYGPSWGFYYGSNWGWEDIITIHIFMEITGIIMVTMAETEILLITLEEEVVLATILTEIDIQDLDTTLEEIVFHQEVITTEEILQ